MYEQQPSIEAFHQARQHAHQTNQQPRCWGISSDALAAYGTHTGPRPTTPGHPSTPGTQTWTGNEVGRDYPADQADLQACENTYLLAPDPVRERILPVLTEFRNWVNHGINRHGTRVVDREAQAADQAARQQARVDALVINGETRIEWPVVAPEDHNPEAGDDFQDMFIPEADLFGFPGLDERFPTVDHRLPRTTTDRHGRVIWETRWETRLGEWLHENDRWVTYVQSMIVDGRSVVRVVEDILADLCDAITDHVDPYLQDVPVGWVDDPPFVTTEITRVDKAVLAALRDELEAAAEIEANRVVQCEGQTDLFEVLANN